MNTRKYYRTLRGFTIIEVMIVLAIAGVIMAIVFLAVPQLQRGARNSQRDADANKVLTAVNECLSNNNGTISSCLSKSPLDTATAPSTYGTTDPVILTPPNGNLDLSKIQQLTTINLYVSTNNAVPTPTAVSGTATAAVYAGNVCSGNTATTTNAGTNSFVVLYNREPNSAACLSP